MLDTNALTADDVASALRISKNSVYRLAKAGDIESYRVGRKLRFTERAVRAYIEHAETKGEAACEGRIGLREGGAAGEQALPGEAHGAGGHAGAESKAPAGELRLPSAFELPGAATFTLAGNDVSGDLLANALNAAGVRASRAYVGSYTALVNLYAGLADAALLHLFDNRTNSYNVPFVERIAPGMPVVAVRILKRRQGFIVREGNPKRISTWGSLLRDGTRLANRARGCATRVLLDEKMISLEARPDMIEGYDEECASAAACAALVASGAADVALGVERLAKSAPGLSFVPMQTEWLDLAVVKSARTKPLVKAILSITASEEFRRDIDALDGCEAANTGAIVYEC